MSLPTLNAEASLYTSRVTYRSSPARNLFAGAVTPSSVPTGSYLNSCLYCNEQCDGDGCFLFCSCYDENGNSQPTAIDVFDCVGYDIANCNGQLRCGGCPGFV